MIDRQRHRRRHRRRPPAPAPPAADDRPGGRGAAPPLQPHGHRPAGLRPLGDAGAVPQPGRLVRRAQITTWLNTRALGIDRARREVVLGGGEALPYDRLDARHGLAQLRPADRRLRRAGHRRAARRPTTRCSCAPTSSATARSGRPIAGGGLLGLEAAYALHKLGLKTTVLERSAAPAPRQLDARAAELLRSYLEGLGLEVVVSAETALDRRRRPPVGRHARRRPLARHRRCCSSRPASRRTSTWPRRPA